jgi:hypothetical protein
LIGNGNDSEYQKEMDEASSDMKNGEAKQPKNEQYYCNCPNHNHGLYDEIVTNINALCAILFRPAMPLPGTPPTPAPSGALAIIGVRAARQSPLSACA